MNRPLSNFKQAVKEPGKLIKGLIRHPRKTVIKLLERDLPAVKNPRETYDPDIFTRLPLAYYKTQLGDFYVPSQAPNDIVSKAIRKGSLFERHVVDVAKTYAKPGTLLLDIGANFGQMSVLFSRLMGDDGMVFSFEAQKYCHAILQKNIAANQCQNVRAFYGAVMEKGGGEVFFPEPDLSRFETYGAYPLSLKSETKEPSGVPTLAIDDLQIEMPISFCKIDTQGSDIFGMRGMRKTIEKHQMPILFEYEERFQEEFGTCFQDYVDFVQSVNYRFVKTFADINYLIMPAPAKIISIPPTAAPTYRHQQNDSVAITRSPFDGQHCQFLKTENEIVESTNFLRENGYVTHTATPKNWELAHLIPEIGDGNLLDLSHSDSSLLKNVCLKKTMGKKYALQGMELISPVHEVNKLNGSFDQIPLPNQHLNTMVYLSANQSLTELFAKEAARLLVPGGKLFVSFNYWNPSIQSATLIAGQIFDRKLTEELIAVFKRNQLRLVQELDWSTQDAIIRPGYYSIHANFSYTFGILTFEKSE